jgi:hypothetical protein
MPVKYHLLNSVPLTLDEIQLCAEPLPDYDQAHWRQKFDLVMKELQLFEKYIPEIYFEGQKIRTNAWWIDYSRKKNRPLVTYFQFRPGQYHSYCVSGLIRFLEYDRPIVHPSLKSRIKSWFKKCF